MDKTTALFQTIPFGVQQVPGIWRFMLPEEFFWLRPPSEKRATCNKCYKVELGDFDPRCQCCTYFPQIPNFMLGLALKDAQSRPHVEALIASGYALPRGMIITPARFKVTLEAYSRDLFGREPRIRCPFIQQGSGECAIYPYRNSICSMFFCANDHGLQGEAYWTKVQQVVGHVESVLAIWVLEQLGVQHDEYIAKLDSLASRIPSCSETDTSGWSLEVQQLLWGDQLGHEKEFFLKCAELIIDNLDRLFEIAGETPFRDSIRFEQAVRDWLPPECRADLPPVTDATNGYEELPSLWYKLQLADRKLWELPFGELAALNEGAVIANNPLDDAESRANAQMKQRVTLQQEKCYLSEREAAVLRLFETPQLLGEALFESPALEGLEDPREFLAICFRRNILQTVES